MRPRAHGPLLLLLLLGAACSAPSERAGDPREAAAIDEPTPPALDPDVLDQVAALAVGEGVVYLAGEAGVLRLDPLSGSYFLMPEAEGVSSQGAAALALAPDGTLWSAHRSDRIDPSSPRGGVRVFPPGAARPRAFLEADGLLHQDVAALALSEARVVVAVGEVLAQHRLDGSDEGFVPFFDEASRRLQVVQLDEEGSVLRRVIEFRPRGERVLSLALAEPLLWIGTTHGLYRLSGEQLLRYEIPCRVDALPPRRVQALAATPRGVIAVLGLDTQEGQWRSGGLLELEVLGRETPGGGRGGRSAVAKDGETSWHCHVPDLDVPDALALAVASDGHATWLASYQGPTRIVRAEAELFDLASGAPDLPATAIALVPQVASTSSCWVGTWGGGAWHLEGASWTSYSFAGQPSGTALIERGTLRSD